MEYKELFKRVGANIAYYRKLRELTQEQAAEMAGTVSRYWSEIETGKTNPTLGIIFKIATALDVDVSRLFEKRA